MTTQNGTVSTVDSQHFGKKRSALLYIKFWCMDVLTFLLTLFSCPIFPQTYWLFIEQRHILRDVFWQPVLQMQLKMSLSCNAQSHGPLDWQIFSVVSWSAQLEEFNCYTLAMLPSALPSVASKNWHIVELAYIINL